MTGVQTCALPISVTEAQLDQARLTLKTIADYVSDFDADEAYASFSKIVDLADNFDFWKDDMTSDARNFVFGELKKNIVDDGKEDFFEELIRLSASDEKAKAEFAKSNITIISDNSLDIISIMTMTVEGNSDEDPLRAHDGAKPCSCGTACPSSANRSGKAAQHDEGTDFDPATRNEQRGDQTKPY